MTACTVAFDELTRLELTRVIEHILDIHHSFLRRELPRLSAAIRDAARGQATAHADLAALQLTFDRLADELAQHLDKEEQILFPMIRTLGSAERPRAFHCGSIRNPIRVMNAEHEDAQQLLARLRELTGRLAATALADHAGRALINDVRAFEADLLLHIHEEDELLFPRAEADEERRLSATSEG